MAVGGIGMASSFLLVYAAAALLVLVVICIGGCFLQVYLSKKEPMILGFILPVLAFLSSVPLVLGGAALLTQQLMFTIGDTMPILGLIGIIVAAFAIANIPTCLFLAVYFISRTRQNQKKLLRKMNIQDLG
jgi:hypothetical protein